VTAGTGPISSASGDPPCAAQHGPHTTARNTVARGRPTRTRHVTHNSPSDNVASSSVAASVLADSVDGTAAEDDVNGAWSRPVGVSPARHTGPRRVPCVIVGSDVLKGAEILGRRVLPGYDPVDRISDGLGQKRLD
jgi:hypothetical protein